MQLPDPKSLKSASTARTYPVEARELVYAVEKAVRELPGWSLVSSSEMEEVRASRKTRVLGFTDDVTVRLTPSPSGAHTNTRAAFQSASRLGLWDLGQNRRNLDELLAAIDQELIG